MTKNKFLIILTVLALAFSLPGCQDFFEDVNVDPNNPVEVTPNVILPQVQVRLAWTIWGEGSRFLGILTQHVDGIARQFFVFQQYELQPDDMDSFMGDNLYSGVLMDNRQLMQLADENGYHYYAGIARALEAYTMLFMTDTWGDLPYSEAFKGVENLQPKFDPQEQIYNAVFTRISEARTLLSGEEGPVATTNDLIYNGDPAQWLKFLNVLEARAHLHLAARDGGSYGKALAALQEGGFESASDEPRLAFGNGASETGPWFQFIQDRDDTEVGASYTTLLNSLNDPRINTLGAAHDVSDNPANYSHPIFTRNWATPFMTYPEQLFMLAEIQFEMGQTADAHQAYLDGIAASFEQNEEYFLRLETLELPGGPVPVSEVDFDQLLADYLAQSEVDPGENGLTLEHIMTQKYIALYADPEVFNDWRRTGIPELDPNTGSQIPRRLPYAEQTILLNDNTPSPADLTIFSRVWWDVQ
ncbi:MAG: SusD/RagB family nutrient-binding outer membrane lipoprotein [Saprospiraceae bacterium]|nr:SusD/RagB family nutrient-binding outer membrane lipoprotein [Saprospiraceae bacterium]MCB0624646.1 SusD/RagB family nutrient-binding outer membrane lipoprotein [Saprospiraceae bacterium]MCB0676817.1 SusD/RagB family nutrient-binding outer membrane lipoprotein [Saprospiraceae bacterium]MCB0682863.1 SusD/RagB family nutrient-binding outer membrane lipoprotein [Saprospiraceae bacterium]